MLLPGPWSIWGIPGLRLRLRLPGSVVGVVRLRIPRVGVSQSGRGLRVEILVSMIVMRLFRCRLCRRLRLTMSMVVGISLGFLVAGEIRLAVPDRLIWRSSLVVFGLTLVR